MLSAEFICAGREYATYERPIAAPVFKKTFCLETIPRDCVFYICGLGFYRAFVNDHEITKGMLAPYISNPDQVVFYDKYQIEKYMCRGENTLYVLLGNGMQNSIGGNIWDFDKAHFRGAPKMSAVCYADGGKLFESDTDFLVKQSPILFDDLRGGEVYDARIDMHSLAGWNPAVMADEPKGEKRISEAEPVRLFSRGQAVQITASGSGYIYDFGVVTAGICKLRISGEIGQKIHLRYGEIVRNGRLDISNIVFKGRSYEDFVQHDIYICGGRKDEVYTPSFTYHGFRYVYVEGIRADQATKDLLECLEIHSDLRDKTFFKCSDSVVNQIFQNAKRSDLSNFVYFPTDCPQREKNGWSGDIAVSAEQMMLHFNAEKSLKEWFHCFCAAQNEDGVVPCIVPTAEWGYEWGTGPAWDNVLVQVPYQIYRFCGEKDVIYGCTDTILKYFQYLKTRRDSRGLYAFGLGDWCQPLHSCDRYTTPLAVTDSIIVSDIYEKASVLFEAIGRKEDAQSCRNEAETVRNAIRAHLVTECAVLEGRTQTGQAMGLYYNIFEEKNRQKALRVLIDLIHANGDCFDTGILGARVIFHVLSEYGYGDLALRMILNEKCPSYAYQVSLGATTLWEEFHPIITAGGEFKRPDDRQITSLNHHFFGDVSNWFMREIAGIRVNDRVLDHEEIVVKPYVFERIDSCDASYIARGGKLSVHMEKAENGKVLVCITKPKGLKVSVEAPLHYMYENKTGCGSDESYLFAKEKDNGSV